MISNAAATPQQPHQEKDPARILAKQFNMTDAEAEMILCIVRKNDPDLELLKLPKVQEIISHRKGRWIQEEEDFSLFLCEEFSLGLSKLDNGVTKRAYLSNKLHCPKMRISKKFKGKNPGKDVFVQKEYQKGKQKDGREFTPEELWYYEQRHEELEKRFLKAVLKTTLKSGIRQKKGSKMSALSLDASSGSSQQSASIDANLPAKQPPTIAIPSGQSATIAMKSSTTGMMKLPATPFERLSDGASPVNNMGCNEFPATNIAIPSCPRPVEQTKTNAMQHISMPFTSAGNAMLPTNNIGFTQNPATQITMQQNVPSSAPLIQDPQAYLGFVPFFSAPGPPNTDDQIMTTSSVVNIPTSVTELPSSTSSTPPQTMIGQGPIEPDIMQLYSSFVQSMNSQQPSPTSTLMSSTPVGLNHGPAIVGMQPPAIPLHGTHPFVLGTQLALANQSNFNANTLMKMPMSQKIQVKGQFGVGHNSMATTQGNASGCNQGRKCGQNTASSSISAYGQNSTCSSVSSCGQSTTNSSVSANNSVHVGMKNNMIYTLPNGLSYSRKRAGAEIVGLLGCDFAASLDAGGGKRFKSSQNAAVSHAVSTSTSEPSSNDESENVSSSNEASFSYGISKRKDLTSKNDSEIPDILSGFDQHVATMKSGATIPEDSHFFAGAGGTAESPYVTSKSFDELHQFLGKGLSVDKMPPPLDLNQSISNYNPVPHHTDARSLTRTNLANRGAFIPVVPQMPIGINPQQYLSAYHQYGRPSSVSNSSELTFSD